jgi:hypothetical protein
VLHALHEAFDDDIDFPFGGHTGMRPEVGRVVIFPGWLLHHVEPTAGACTAEVCVPRVAVSFNIRGSWRPTGSNSHRRQSHLDASYYVSLVIIHTKYNKARLNDSTAHC